MMKSSGALGEILNRVDREGPGLLSAPATPKEQLAKVHREVRAGRADSVSGYIARVLAEHEKRESLQVLLRDLIEQYGKPGAEDVKWAERALAPRRRG